MTDSRFVPGSIVAERYRIVALLGRGGMGDVYRAEDLTLEQDVALKFLPERLGESEPHLARFVEEVRMARRVSHPSICRVHDIGDVDGRRFISMEYVDGEDLASLLRRVGRLPSDRASELAHQLCAGLSAAHDQGVLHRDLKPANVMVDGEGNAKIADFGLAAVASAVDEDEARVGTPGYMAPEQLRDGQVSVRSDLFSLGLVLHELFTGHSAFQANTIEELLEAHKKSDPNPSSFLPDIDPVVDAVIRRCLARDPEDRPQSAREVAGALPGGDPLAAALAAGETPSPELVAASGGAGTLSRPVGLTLLAIILLGLVVVVIGDRRIKMIELVRPELPPAALADRARTIAEELGVDQEGGDSAFGFVTRVEGALLGAADQERGRELLGHPLAGSMRFWFRTSPRPLVPEGSHGKVSWNRPPMEVPRMTRLILGHDGALQMLESVPTNADASEEPYDWSKLFALARLEQDRFTELEGVFVPDDPYDQKKIWRGTPNGVPEAEVTITAAAFGSRLVHFAMRTSWRLEQRKVDGGSETLRSLFDYTTLGISVLACIGGIWFGWRNLSQRRGDVRNATRLAVYLFALAMLRWLTQGDHVSDFAVEWRLLVSGAGDALWEAMVCWFLYMALEPTVRRIWPHRLVSWNRMLAGRFRDPAIGRDVLIGVAGAAVSMAVMRLNWFAVAATEQSLAWPHHVEIDGLLGPSHVLGQIAWEQAAAAFIALMAPFLYVLCLIVFKRPWVSVGILFIVAMIGMPYTVMGSMPLLDAGFRAIQAVAVLFVLLRGGLVGMFALMFTTGIVREVSFTLDFSPWWSGASLAVTVVVVGLAVYGYSTSTRRASS